MTTGFPPVKPVVHGIDFVAGRWFSSRIVNMTIKISDSDRLVPPRATRIRSVARACQILLQVAEREERTAREIAAAFGLPLPTCYHLLNTLVAEGLLAKDTRRQYHLGPMVGSLSDAFLRRLAAREDLMQELYLLAQTTGETALVSAWRNGEVTVLASVEGDTAVRVAGLHSGYTAHGHARSSGKLLLALAPGPVRDAYLRSHTLEPLTRHTIVQRGRLLGEFVRIRECGYAVDEEEFREGVACVSAPVIENGVASAALTVSAPVERFRRRRNEYTEAVLTAAAAASDELEVMRGSGGA
jgi:IclR family transcriptional regulator, acetate operon repressor